MSNQTATAVLATLGALCLVLVQFLPWGGVDETAFGASMEARAMTWRMETEGSGFGFEGSDKASWYSDDVEDDEGDLPDGVLQVRVAIPFLLVGLVVVAVAALLGFLGNRATGALALVGALVAATGVVLFALGVDSLFDGDHDWGASFYLGIAGAAAALVAGVLGLAGRRAGA